ncbi:MAG: MerR family transcriptional regulator [Polaromonas sp.]
MNEHEAGPAQSFSIAGVERETGLSKDTLRVWERRYGFPCPRRDGAGDRLYPVEQVERLRLIRRLMDAGHRPGRIVALSPQALQALSAQATGPGSQLDMSRVTGLDAYLDLIQRHDLLALRHRLSQAALRLGLVDFITRVVAPLNTAVGEAWMQGRCRVFEEHLYTECVTGVMRNAIAGVPAPQGAGAPRVLLTTFPEEPHGLGLLMAEALFALEGCNCLPLGPQTPVSDIAGAAQAHGTDIVALSFTRVLGPNAVVAGLTELRRQLPPQVSIWAGGCNPVLSRREIPGVLPVQALEAIRDQVARWRGRAVDAVQNAVGA